MSRACPGDDPAPPPDLPPAMDDPEERAAIQGEGSFDTSTRARATLAGADDPHGRDAWGAWWRDRVAARVALGTVTAERRTWAEALALWHAHHGERAEPGRCTGCGEPVARSSAILLHDGAAVHGDRGEHGLRCLVAYGQRWRTRAAEGLSALGILRPAGVGDDDA